MEQLKETLNKSYMNWDVTLELARKELSKIKPGEAAWRAGVKYDEVKKEFIVPFLNEEYHIKYPTGDVYHPQGREIPVVNRILTLHYLNSAKGVPIKHKWISFKELPSGQIYIDPFYNRAVRPLIKLFGQEPEALLKAGLALGGKRENLGDSSVTISVFPMVPITYVIWRGDEEFPPSGNILFDASAPNYLPLEDYAIIAGMVVYELRKKADQLTE
ncbi:MAG: DUF3786 domain-containing protein [Bacillota bacterium]|nr:DUF3786 domain-containing protein [Bacillota bacterium]